MKFANSFEASLNYDDVFILPGYSEISTRKDVSVAVNVANRTFRVPVINANMDTVASKNMAVQIANAGGVASLHRFQTIEKACKEYLETVDEVNQIYSENVFVSIGVNRDSKERAMELYTRACARNFIIDIAHGHSKQMRDMIEWIKQEYPDTYIMAGNVGTKEGVFDLASWGADAVKLGIGPGAVCLTKNVTGVTVPMFTCIVNAVEGKREYKEHTGKSITLVADGGCREIGDVCKAIAAGADLVMTGKLFAGCTAAPIPGCYRGSASEDVQNLYRSNFEYVPTPEGKSIVVEQTGESAAHIVEHIAGGLRSSYSYVGARNTEEFRRNAKFGIRMNKP